MPEVHFCLVGAGINAANQKLMNMITMAEIPVSHLHLLDARRDIAYLMAGLDVYGLPSAGDLFQMLLAKLWPLGCLVW